MAREFSRTDRVGQQIHKEIASILQQEFKHRVPDLGLITVSDVEVSKDLGHAKVYVTFYSDDEDKNKVDLKALKEGASFMRGLLSKRVRMRNTPSIHFVRDTSITEGVRISSLVDQVIRSDEQKKDN
ncbi:30S ribosome-binding factor RbfA [Agaribacter flavus]|uniref:Ribosome-binding factor A n=1 Tax=Agaribacter flavus TaxID=1902781 RepID=A0ABV7FMT2_9ALTE